MSENYRKKHKQIIDVRPEDGARKRLKASSQNSQLSTGFNEEKTK